MPVFYLILACLFSTATAAGAATIYVDKHLTADCTAGNYSLAHRNCSGSDGDALQSPATALTNSASGDTIIIRAGTYTFSAPLMPKTGQTWQRYNTELVTLDGSNGAAARLFHVSNVSNVIIDGFTLVNAGYEAVWASIGVTGGHCDGTTVRNTIINGWNWNNLDSTSGIKFSQCQRGDIEGNSIGNPKNGVSAHLLSAGGIDVEGDCATKAGGGTQVKGNAIQGAEIGQGIRLTLCAGHPDTPGGRHVIENNAVMDTRLGLRVETGSSGMFLNNFVQNSGVAAFESLARGADSISGLALIGNTFDTAGENLVRFLESDPAGVSKNVVFQDNVLITHNAYPELMVQQNTAQDPSNVWQGNQFGPPSALNAICWAAPSGSSSLSCPSGGTLYTLGQLSLFNTATGMTGNRIQGEPLPPVPCP